MEKGNFTLWCNVPLRIESWLWTACACAVAIKSADLDMAHARPGSFAIKPTPGMVALRRDYGAMEEMKFGEVPEFPDIVEAVK
jgi:hypothetical protein